MSIVNKIKYYNMGQKENPKYFYTQDELKEFEDYITKTFGEFDTVYHELYSPDIHVDIIIVPPSVKENYYKLITMGMGAYKMNVPKTLEDYNFDRSELIIFLPPEWNMKFTDKEYGWIANNLKTISRIPIDENSWIGFGHTFSYSLDGDIPLANNIKFSSILLIDALSYNKKELHLNLENKGKINFYQLIPLYKEELQYLNRYGLEKLLEKLIKSELNIVVDINRKNCCDKDLESNLKETNFNIESIQDLER